MPAAFIGWTTPAVSNGTTLPLPSVMAAVWTLTLVCRRKTALSLLDLGTLPVRVLISMHTQTRFNKRSQKIDIRSSAEARAKRAKEAIAENFILTGGVG